VLAAREVRGARDAVHVREVAADLVAAHLVQAVDREEEVGELRRQQRELRRHEERELGAAQLLLDLGERLELAEREGLPARKAAREVALGGVERRRNVHDHVTDVRPRRHSAKDVRP
jgi:hypothetical protein